MAEQTPPGIYLIVEFDWPTPFIPEPVQKAKHLHQILQSQTWIRDIISASGGVGSGSNSIWIFRLEQYAALDRLLRDRSDEVSQAYIGSFTEMIHVKDKIREEVVFLTASEK